MITSFAMPYSILMELLSGLFCASRQADTARKKIKSLRMGFSSRNDRTSPNGCVAKMIRVDELRGRSRSTMRAARTAGAEPRRPNRVLRDGGGEAGAQGAVGGCSGTSRGAARPLRVLRGGEGEAGAQGALGCGRGRRSAARPRGDADCRSRENFNRHYGVTRG